VRYRTTARIAERATAPRARKKHRDFQRFGQAMTPDVRGGPVCSTTNQASGNPRARTSSESTARWGSTARSSMYCSFARPQNRASKLAPSQTRNLKRGDIRELIQRRLTAFELSGAARNTAARMQRAPPAHQRVGRAANGPRRPVQRVVRSRRRGATLRHRATAVRGADPPPLIRPQPATTKPEAAGSPPPAARQDRPPRPGSERGRGPVPLNHQACITTEPAHQKGSERPDLLDGE